MKQYLELLQTVKDTGEYKDEARSNMPRTKSIFGYQFRHDLNDGFPLLTTKKIPFKLVVVEALWFLRADTHLKYLNDNGFKMWNSDGYNYYTKIAKGNLPAEANCLYKQNEYGYSMYTFEEFVEKIKTSTLEELNEMSYNGYTFGSCGYQYGWLWRKYDGVDQPIDQIVKVLNSLKSNPSGRRHIVTATDPAHSEDLALTPCHAFYQFNCRKIEYFEGDDVVYGESGKFYRWVTKPTRSNQDYRWEPIDAKSKEEILNSEKYPIYYLDCQAYIRSNDLLLGAPFNIASYALLIHMFCEILGMEAGTLVYTIGDAHIYENHLDAVDIQLSRSPKELPKLHITGKFKKYADVIFKDGITTESFNEFINIWSPEEFEVIGYNPDAHIKGELSTGMVK